MAKKKCSVDGCNKPHSARGWCRKHYERWARQGDPLKLALTPSGVPLQWLRDQIKNCGDECIEWPFHTVSGYGKLEFRGRNMTASRCALILHTGEDPRGMFANHGPCHNRLCCNPLHLSWGTGRSNQADRLRDGTHQLGERNAMAKLTTEDVKAIRADTRSSYQIANDFGVTAATIRQIRQRRSWKHV